MSFIRTEYVFCVSPSSRFVCQLNEYSTPLSSCDDELSNSVHSAGIEILFFAAIIALSKPVSAKAENGTIPNSITAAAVAEIAFFIPFFIA